MIPELTERELHVLAHSLGINLYGAQRSQKKKDRRLPDDFYRNYFAAKEGHADYPELLSLTEKGLMIASGVDTWHVTYDGQDIFRIKFFRLMQEPAIT